MHPFLKLLLGGTQAGSQPIPAMPNQTPSAVSPDMRQRSLDIAYADEPEGPAPQAMPEVDAVVTGPKPFKSKIKKNWLGIIGDAFLAQGGRPAVYAPRLKQQRMAEAMEGFTQDPRRAAEALNHVDTAAAAGFWDRSQDNARQTGVSDAQLRVHQDRYDQNTLTRAGGMIGAINDGNRAEMTGQLRSYVEGRNYPVPEGMDWNNPDHLEMLRMGAFPVKDQENLESRERYQGERLEDYDEAQDERVRVNDERLEDADLKRGETTRHNKAMEARPTRGAKGPIDYSGKTVGIQDAGGNMRKVQFSPDGTKAVSNLPGGRQIRYRVQKNGKLKVDHIK